MRRPNGTGTITKMSGSRRKPYAVRVPARDKHGRVVQKYLSYHATQKEALEALERYRTKSSSGTAPAPESLSVTLGDVYTAWSARKYASGISASAISTYKASWKRLKHLEGVNIRNIGIDSWQAVLDTDARNGASKSTISKDSVLIKSLSRFALERDWITKDYAQFLVIPSSAPKFEKGAFNELELKRIEHLAAEGVQGADAALVLCYTGFRITELLTLTHFSFDAQAQTLTGGMKTEAGKIALYPFTQRSSHI